MSFTVHGQVVMVNPRRSDQYIVMNNNQRTNDNDNDRVPAPQQRTRVLDCGRQDGQPLIWFPGHASEVVPPAAEPLVQ